MPSVNLFPVACSENYNIRAFDIKYHSVITYPESICPILGSVINLARKQGKKVRAKGV